jgi:hypothetical protein
LLPPPLLLSALSLSACLLGLRLSYWSRLVPARRRVAPRRITLDWAHPFRVIEAHARRRGRPAGPLGEGGDAE